MLHRLCTKKREQWENKLLENKFGNLQLKKLFFFVHVFRPKDPAGEITSLAATKITDFSFSRFAQSGLYPEKSRFYVLKFLLWCLWDDKSPNIDQLGIRFFAKNVSHGPNCALGEVLNHQPSV